MKIYYKSFLINNDFFFHLSSLVNDIPILTTFNLVKIFIFAINTYVVQMIKKNVDIFFVRAFETF